MPVRILATDDHEIGRVGHHLLCSSRQGLADLSEASDGQSDSGPRTLIAELQKGKPVYLA